MDITYQPAVGPAVPVKGIFGEPYLLEQSDLAAGVEATAPTVFLKLDALPIDPEFDDPTLVIGGVTYRVVERMPAGLGSIMLRLRKA
jgi:hypothetical protein